MTLDAKSDALETEILNYYFRSGSAPQPTDIELALSSDDPGEDGSTINEPSGGYARLLVPATSSFWNAPTPETGGGMLITNSTSHTFGPATTNWGAIRYLVAFRSSDGMMLYYSRLSRTVTKDVGGEVTFRPGRIRFIER